MKAEYESDIDEDIRDMAEFARENRELMSRVGKRTASMRMSNEVRENKPGLDIGKCIVLTIIATLLGSAYFFLLCDSEKTELTSIITNCWEQFKDAKCNLNNPVGALCEELY